MMAVLKNALVQCVLLLGLSAVLLLALEPPIPRSAFGFYMVVIAAGLGVYVTSTTTVMESFWSPIRTLLVDDRWVFLRWTVLLAVPLVVAVLAGISLMPSNMAPASLRVIHPAPPASILFDGKSIDLREAASPMREAKGKEPEKFAAHVEEGRRVYYQNCFQCHGDHLAGDGMYAGAFNPRPANFQDVGTIAQLQESYLFWRIAKGGPGLPAESAPGSSAMPRWEGTLNEQEIWAVILFLYEKTGHAPRTWE